MHPRGTLLPRHWLQRWVLHRYERDRIERNLCGVNTFVCACYRSRLLVLNCVFVPVDGGWTPWSVWSDCSVTCGHGTQIRTHACINPPPRNNGSDCLGPERETRDCPTLPCLGLFTDFLLFIIMLYWIYILYSEPGFVVAFDGISADDLCPWSPWSSCSQSCGAGSVSRRRMCLCEAAGDETCPAEIEAERNRQENQLCYKQPCPSKLQSTRVFRELPSLLTISIE